MAKAENRTEVYYLGEVAEWLNAAVSKTVVPFGYQRFESSLLRHKNFNGEVA